MEPTNILTLLDELDEKARILQESEAVELGGELDRAMAREEYFKALTNAYPTLASELRRATACIKELGEDNAHLNTYVRQIMTNHGFADFLKDF